jgi:hypothetical protein
MIPFGEVTNAEVQIETNYTQLFPNMSSVKNLI